MTKQEWKIGDCLDLIKDIPDNSIDLIICDPPYYKIDSSEWDNQWKTFEDYIKWLEVRAVEMKRVLKDNGSLYMFGDDHRIAYIQVMMDKYFTFLNQRRCEWETFCICQRKNTVLL
jgi:site-specific DNA-methyltransferase (adenine-specific)